ncbi:DinB family protein [Cytobacillus firmus]|uniref:DinB family protein n=1 Tax=Cytobacillus firmus TaxID=1399 RepID=UPI00157FD808|nr:DinB family protein [Cytobacillus firmus]MBG9548900.1 damage-inducible protein DinB [Cytobacillus firmus]MBG9602235.1 damage-inducible protein DinB [Cytobacillus firmus]MBG9655851.1 damage-inducible protein DinB [Cytobacillus firmus]MDD9313646.1 DinB family protein [Cytobacillus firmus]MED1904423.1 DinB family protein [Cytobacillus firmus]
MLTLFRYNWQVRDEWFEWCRQLSAEELNANRTGGVGGILETLFHIVDVEYSWICAIQGKEVKDPLFSDYDELEKVRALSEEYRMELESFFQEEWPVPYNEFVTPPWMERQYKKGDILNHVIVHEIHHIGQLSVWAREMNLTPISANLIGRNLNQIRGMENDQKAN